MIVRTDNIHDSKEAPHPWFIPRPYKNFDFHIRAANGNFVEPRNDSPTRLWQRYFQNYDPDPVMDLPEFQDALDRALASGWAAELGRFGVALSKTSDRYVRGVMRLAVCPADVFLKYNEAPQPVWRGDGISTFWVDIEWGRF